MTNIDVAKQSFLAYANSDRPANEAVIAEDFVFTSPLDNRIGRETYFERCWPNHEAITDFKFVRLVEHGNEVIVTYEGTSQAGQVFRNTEVLTIRDSKITAVEVYFGWNVPHDAPQGGFLGGDES
jgi:ketosteroid isomerase-like protein